VGLSCAVVLDIMLFAWQLGTSHAGGVMPYFMNASEFFVMRHS
jgi:hypothetical protein